MKESFSILGVFGRRKDNPPTPHRRNTLLLIVFHSPAFQIRSKLHGIEVLGLGRQFLNEYKGATHHMRGSLRVHRCYSGAWSSTQSTALVSSDERAHLELPLVDVWFMALSAAPTETKRLHFSCTRQEFRIPLLPRLRLSNAARWASVVRTGSGERSCLVQLNKTCFINRWNDEWKWGDSAHVPCCPSEKALWLNVLSRKLVVGKWHWTVNPYENVIIKSQCSAVFAV